LFLQVGAGWSRTCNTGHLLLHQCTRAPEQWCTRVVIHQCTRAPMHQRSGAPMHQCSGAPEQWCTNAPEAPLLIVFLARWEACSSSMCPQGRSCCQSTLTSGIPSSNPLICMCKHRNTQVFVHKYKYANTENKNTQGLYPIDSRISLVEAS
jgi:hypothetical protein